MEDTIERALRSVLDQLDARFEVFVVEDGSSDNSPSILARLENEYPSLRVLYLKRDRSRQLGETRNISVRNARGQYVILHVDADDEWMPLISEFVAIFHNIEAALGRNVLLSGQQINIGRRDFLLPYGPYRNTHRAQDRDMWLRLAADDAYLPILHQPFRTRLPRPRKVQFFKSIRDMWFHMLYDLRRGTAVGSYILNCVVGPFRPSMNFGIKERLARAALIVPAFITSWFMEPLPPPKNMTSHAEFVAYRDTNAGTYQEIMRRLGAPVDMSFLSPEGMRIFTQKPARIM
jgi:glycosyltransferase involved in cell wall biosynthesis